MTTEQQTHVEDHSVLMASSAAAEESLRVLKHNETFAVFDRYGNVNSRINDEQGIYYLGTRHLSLLLLHMCGEQPLLLSSNVNEDNAILSVDLANPVLQDHDGKRIERGTIYINRVKFLYYGQCVEKLRITNYGLEPATFSIQMEFNVDFKDIFEVRGHVRERRGTREKPVFEDNVLRFSYMGLDHQTRETKIHFSPTPTAHDGQLVEYKLNLVPHETANVEVIYGFYGERPKRREIHPAPEPTNFDTVYIQAATGLRAMKAEGADIITDNEQFNDWLKRSFSDIHMMLSETPWGPYPYAGVPWFSAPFGRDGIITAMEMLWVNPNIARSVLDFLAHYQAKEKDDKKDAEPGKILHEARTGELANLGEIPFKQYYGSVDSTPLFIMLAGMYYERTGDIERIAGLWEHLEAAMSWIDQYGDRDGDGFVEYHRHSPDGLENQGWKDSNDSVFHDNGQLAESPIALVEVQAYVYAAKVSMSALANVLGKHRRAEELAQQAAVLQHRFATAFWLDDRKFYALALDKYKRPLRVLTSNAGHALFTGIATPEQAAYVADQLLDAKFFSGWGIRTVAKGEARYNPMIYHNGTVWPHDNAIIAAGLARYRFKDKALQILTGLFDVSVFVDLNRLPELFCGFSRIGGRGPTLYPVSCAPQSWAAGAVFMVLGACLGIQIDGVKQRLRFYYPVMPSYLQKITIRNLNVGKDGFVDVELINHTASVGVNVLRRTGQVEIATVT